MARNGCSACAGIAVRLRPEWVFDIAGIRIKKEDLALVRTAVANYARLRRLVDRWIDLGTALSDLKLQQRAAVRSGDGTAASKRR